MAAVQSVNLLERTENRRQSNGSDRRADGTGGAVVLIQFFPLFLKKMCCLSLQKHFAVRDRSAATKSLGGEDAVETDATLL